MVSPGEKKQNIMAHKYYIEKESQYKLWNFKAFVNQRRKSNWVCSCQSSSAKIWIDGPGLLSSKVVNIIHRIQFQIDLS